jgi:hypothetical protein
MIKIHDAKRMWEFCYDTAHHFRNDNTPAGLEFFRRAKDNALALEATFLEPLGEGLAMAMQWKRGDK